MLHEGDYFKGESGWSSVHAADGYRLRCEWSAEGSSRHMSFTELAPVGTEAHLLPPVPFTAYVETLNADEDALAQSLSKTSESIVQKVFEESGHAHRAVHAKSHAILFCELDVHTDLPLELAQGIFNAPRRYGAAVRVSSIAGDLLNDNIALPRGFAIKLFDVEGLRLPGSEDSRTQDFVMAHGTEFPAADLKSFLSSLELLASTTDKAEWAKSALSAVLRPLVRAQQKLGLPGGRLQAFGGYPLSNPLGERYGTQAAYRFGEYIAKLDVVPASDNFLALTGKEFTLRHRENAIRDEMALSLATQGGAWTLRAQLCRDFTANPLEDASIAWPEEHNPYLPIATLTVKPQASWSPALSKMVDDGMAFSPWHGIDAHRPLGIIGRVRQRVYPRLASYRGALNGCPIHEPRGMPQFPVA